MGKLRKPRGPRGPHNTQTPEEFRAEIDAKIAKAPRVAGVPVLPADDEGESGDSALVKALADLVEAQCKPLADEEPRGRDDE